MPTVVAYQDHPTHPYVRVETNWADVPSVTKVRVVRVDAATGEETFLRPYICYDGDCLLLSCGHAIFWDTEAPFDTPFYYRAEPCPDEAMCLPALPVVSDSFTRVTANGLGTADTGQTWTVAAGAAANHATTGSVATQTATAVTNLNLDVITGVDSDITISVDTSVPVGTPTGGNLGSWFVARYTDANNYYLVRLDVTTAGNVILQMYKRVGGVLSGSLGLVTVGTGHVAGHVWRVKLQVWAPNVKAKAWNRSLGEPEPVGWQIEIVDMDLTDGDGFGFGSRLEAGNTDAPVVFAFDNFLAENPCNPCTPVVAETGQLSIVSAGSFWLKDPVRPCHDREVPLCVDGINDYPGVCTVESGISFLSIGTELYDTNGAQLRPMSRRRPIPIVRPRRDASTVLRLATSTFTARDDVLELVIPGTPLLFQGPAEYGVPDRYMDVGQVADDKMSTDMRWQARRIALPYDTVDRPSGPAQGICGVRVADLCDVYSTWDAMTAANISTESILRGAASVPNPVAAWRDWDAVDAGYADWDAEAAGNVDWTDLLDGP